MSGLRDAMKEVSNRRLLRPASFPDGVADLKPQDYRAPERLRGEIAALFT